MNAVREDNNADDDDDGTHTHTLTILHTQCGAFVDIIYGTIVFIRAVIALSAVAVRSCQCAPITVVVARSVVKRDVLQ